MQHLDRHIQQQLNRPALTPYRWNWRRLAVAAAIAIITLIGATLWFGPDKSQQQQFGVPPTQATYNTDDELALWDLALSNEYNPDMVFDDLLITEVLAFFDEADWEMENIFGKENNHEIYAITTFGIDRPGTRCV